MSARRKTFNELLANLELQNAQSLIARARVANRLAKTASGSSRAAAYKIKSQAARALINKIPTRIKLRKDKRPAMKNFVVVEFRGAKLSLHVPQEFVAEKC